jgi:predicted RNase H-like nuclease (RuvC/YqgF family)
MSEAHIGRLQRKLAQRDRRIAGLQRYIAELEHALSGKDIEMKRLPRDVTRAVQEALCNVRMIPVLGLGGGTRIVEVRTAEQEKQT